jgi:brefeldin A-resistance guanine nucleotide exchange factor 1
LLGRLNVWCSGQKTDSHASIVVGLSQEDTSRSSQEVGDMWLRLVHCFRKVCIDQREEVRNHAILSLQRCLSAAEVIYIPPSTWSQCFDQVIFTMLDDLIEIAQGQSRKEYRNMETTLQHAMKFLSKLFLQLLDQLSSLSNFRKLWLGVLSIMEKYMKAKLRGKGSEKLQELIPELLKNMLLILKARGVLVQKSTLNGDGLWEITWLHIQKISPSLKAECFPDQDPEYKPDPKSNASELVEDAAAGYEAVINDGSQVRQEKGEK